VGKTHLVFWGQVAIDLAPAGFNGVCVECSYWKLWVIKSPVSQCNSKFDLHPGPMVWQIILKGSPITLVFYSQHFSPLFFQTSPLFFHYSQTAQFSLTKVSCHDLCFYI